MALPAAPSLNAFHGVATGVPAFALIVTILRLWYRLKRKLAWWDDLLVGFASLWMVLLVIFIWISTVEGPPQHVKVAAYYMCTFTFTLGNYFARLSILLGILRIAPNPRTRLALKTMAAFFVLIMCVLMAQKLWVCEGGSHAWKLEKDPGCHLGMQVSITELVTDIISDAFLVITPLTFLSRSKLKPAQKRRLYAIFGASVATTITSIVQDYLILAAGGLREETASMIEVSVAIIVANLPVIISFFYRLFRTRKSTTSGGEDLSSRSRFATDYSHARRARNTHANALGTREVTSSSDPAVTAITSLGKYQPGVRSVGGNVAIQLGGVRGGQGDDVLDLKKSQVLEYDYEDEDEIVDVEDSKFDSFDHERYARRQSNPLPPSLTSPPTATKPKSRPSPTDLDFTVSAISYSDGRGGRRDAEYDIDIVDDLHDDPRHNATQSPARVTFATDPVSAPNTYPPPVSPGTAPPGVGSGGGFFSSLRRSPSTGLNSQTQVTSLPHSHSHLQAQTQSLGRIPSIEEDRSPPAVSVNAMRYPGQNQTQLPAVNGTLGGVGTAVLVQQQVTVTSDAYYPERI